MRRVAYISDTLYLEHDTGLNHPESSARLQAINRAITPIKDNLISKSPISVSRDILSLVHSQALWVFVYLTISPLLLDMHNQKGIRG